MPQTLHSVIWDDASASEQAIDGAEMMQRLGRVLGADYTEKIFRGEPRYQLRRSYPGDWELSIVAGHIYDDREVLSMVVELHVPGLARPVASVHLSAGIQRVKAAQNTAWLRARNGTIVIVGESLGGIVEVQN